MYNVYIKDNFNMKKQELIVVQKNELVQNTIYKNLSVNDLKLFKLIISKIDSKTTLFKDFYIITYEELNLIDYPIKNRYEIVLNSLKNLASFYIKIDTKEQSKHIGLLQNNFIFKRYDRQFVITIHNDLLEYLLVLKNKFTMYEISNIKNLSNKYELKLYEYIKSFHNRGNSIDLTIKTLRKVLELNEDEYTLYGNLNQRIIKPAIKNISKYTDLTIVVRTIKENKKVVKIRFIHGGK